MLEKKRGWALILSVAVVLCMASVSLSFSVHADRDSGHCRPHRPSRPSYSVSSFWERVIHRIEYAGRGDRIQINAETRTTMPADVLRAMKYSGTTLWIERSGKSTIVIHSYEIGRIPDSKNYYTLSSLAAVYQTVKAGTSSQISASSQEFEYPEFEYPEYEYPSAAQAPRYTVPAQAPSASVPASSSSSSEEPSSSSSNPENASESSDSESEPPQSESSSSSSEPEPPSMPDPPATPAATVNGLIRNPLAPLTFLFLLIAVMSTSGLIAAVTTFLLWKKRRQAY